MLSTPTLEQLERLGLLGMARALREQQTIADIAELPFEDRLGLLVDREMSERADRHLKRRLKQAMLRQTACIADVDCRKGRGLDKRRLLELAGCDWIRRHQNVIVTGSTGVGKSFVACAIAHAACLEGFTVLYRRLGRLLEDLEIGRGDGRYLRLLKQLERVDVLVLDDWGLLRTTHRQQSDLLELLDERHQRRSTIVTSQLPTDHWHEAMTDPTLADAIIDRLVHNAHHIKLQGDSMRKRTAELHSRDESRT